MRSFSLLHAITTVGGWTGISRVLGFVRDMLIANVVGAGLVADAFFIAFQLPNLFRRLFGEGAMNAAFVPLYAKRLEQEGAAAARIFSEQVLAVLTFSMLLLTVAGMAAMPWLLPVFAIGFTKNPETYLLAVALAQITFPYLLFMILCAQFSGMLNSTGRFAAAAAAPVLLNLVMISVLLLLSLDVLRLPGQAMAMGVSVAGAVQFLFLAWSCHKAGILPRLPRPRLTPGVRRLLILMGPGVLGAGVVQINVVIGNNLASMLGEGAISWLYYADRINQLPLGIVGIAAGIVLLPLLTRQLRAGELEAASDSMNRTLELSLLLTLPAAIALIAIPWPIVMVLYERGEFSPADSIAVANALRAFALGLPAYVLIKALSPGFFAREDTKTPVKIAMVNVVLNLLLALALMRFWGHVGIALAAACTAWLNAGALGIILWRRGHFHMDARLKRVLPRLLLSIALMGLAVWGLSLWVAPIMMTGGVLARVGLLASLVLGGGSLYFLLTQLTGAMDLRAVKGMLRKNPLSESGFQP